MSEELKNALDFSDTFDAEISLLDEEMANIDGLYDEVKTHFDSIKGSNNRGVLGFIEKQTGNLVSIKTTKISLIKEKINIKKTKADFEFKKANLNKGSSSLSEGLTKQLFDMISENQGNVKPSDTTSYVESDDDIDSQLDQIFDEHVESGDISSTEITSIMKNEGMGNINDEQEISDENYEVVADMEGNFYALAEDDGELSIVEGVDLSSLSVINIFEDNEVTYAEASDGNIYEVVEFE